MISPGYTLRLTPQTACTFVLVSEVNVLTSREMTMDSVPTIDDGMGSMSSPAKSATSDAGKDV